MTGFEPWTSGVGSDRFTNWATTKARYLNMFNSFVTSVNKSISIEQEEVFYFKQKNK